MFHLTRTLDPTRPVIGNDGWESSATDIIGIHDYDGDPERIARRYGGYESLPNLFARERPGGRAHAALQRVGQPPGLRDRGTEYDDLRWRRDMRRATVSDIANTCEQEKVEIAAAG